MSVYDDMHECDTDLLKKPYYLCNRKKCGDKCIDECYLTSDLFYAADGIDRSQYEAYRFFLICAMNRIGRHSNLNY